MRLNILNETGLTRRYLRHEMKHAEQFQQIVRLLGTENLAKYIKKHGSENFDRLNLFACSEIEKTLGRIPTKQPKGEHALKYLKNFLNYNEVSLSKNSIKRIIAKFKYNNNLIEKEACKAERGFGPNKLTAYYRMIKIAAKTIKKGLRK